MYWKELNFGFLKYYGFLLMSIIMVMFLSKYNSVLVDVKSESINILTVGNDKKTNDLLSNTIPEASIVNVSDHNEGLTKINNSNDMVAYIFHENDNNSFQVILNPKSSKAVDVNGIFENLKNTTEYSLKVLNKELDSADENNNLRNIFNSFSFILTFVCLFVPHKMYTDEKNTLVAIVLSPIKNSTILPAKIISTCLIYFVGCLYFTYSFNLSINVFIVLFLLGPIYSVFGLLAGILSKNKYISYSFYPISALLILLPFFINRMLNYKKIIYALENNVITLLMTVSFQLIIFFILFLCLNNIFKVSLRRERIC